MCRSGMTGPGFLVSITVTAPGHGGCRSWCPCKVNELHGHAELAAWNASLGERWNDFVTDLRRTVGECQYFKVTETQTKSRPALHCHGAFRFDGPVGISKRVVRRLAIRHGFGHEVDVQVVREIDHKRVAYYFGKYVTKTATEALDVPCFDPETGAARGFRRWTSSREWGDSMRSVVEAQRAWVFERMAAEGTGAGPGRRPPAAEHPDGPGDAGGGAFNPNHGSYALRRLVVAFPGAALVVYR